MAKFSRSRQSPRAGVRRLLPAATLGAMNAKGQSLQIIVENGPDPRGQAYWNGLAQRTALELSAEGAPKSVRLGMKGEPMTTYYGDPGALGGLPSPSHGARNAFASLNANQALPATSPPIAMPSTLKELVAEFQ